MRSCNASGGRENLMFNSALIVSEYIRPLRAAASICSRTGEDCHNCSRYAGYRSVGRTRTRAIPLEKFSSGVPFSISTPRPRRSSVPALRQTRKSPARTSTGGGPPRPALSAAESWFPLLATVSSEWFADVGGHPPTVVVLEPPLINRLPRTLASRTSGQPEADSVADTGHPPSARPHGLGAIFHFSAPQTPRVGPAQRPRSLSCAANSSDANLGSSRPRSELRNAKFSEELSGVWVHRVEHCAADGSSHQYSVGVTKSLRQDFVGVDSDCFALHPVPVQSP